MQCNPHTRPAAPRHISRSDCQDAVLRLCGCACIRWDDIGNFHDSCTPLWPVWDGGVPRLGDARGGGGAGRFCCYLMFNLISSAGGARRCMAGLDCFPVHTACGRSCWIGRLWGGRDLGSVQTASLESRWPGGGWLNHARLTLPLSLALAWPGSARFGLSRCGAEWRWNIGRLGLFLVAWSECWTSCGYAECGFDNGEK